MKFNVIDIIINDPENEKESIKRLTFKFANLILALEEKDSQERI